MRASRTKVVFLVLLLVVLLVNFKLLTSTSNTYADVQLPDCECSTSLILRLEGGQDVRKVNLSTAYLQWSKLSPNVTKVFGGRRIDKSYLTIGIPSIRRVNDQDYLFRTLEGLVLHSTEVEQAQMVVVVFLAEMNHTYNDEVVQKIATSYSSQIQMGFIQVVQASPKYYPTFELLKDNFNDGHDRVHWRTKQVLDYAFLFMFCENISQYYIQLEDDVFPARDYLPSIKTFIGYHKSKWAVLEFSELGFIGKLFRSSDLPKLTQFMLTFYQEQPVDWLLRYFRLSMAQANILMRKPTLFQHFGLKSSFDLSHDNKLQDRFFDMGYKRWRSDDPPAVILTTFQVFGDNVPQLAYASGSGFLWVKDPQVGNTLQLVFEEEQRVSKVAVQTGNTAQPNDILQVGIVELSPVVLTLHENRAVCADPVVISNFTNGLVETSVNLTRPTKCVTITMIEPQSNWIAFEQVAVFVHK